MERDNRPRRIWDEGIEMAYDLIQRHPELLADVPPLSDILFVYDDVNEPTSKGRAVMAKLSKISGKLVDFLEAGDKTWMLEWFHANNGRLTTNQQHILLMQQLLLFEPVGEDGDCRIGGYDIQEMEIIADALGLRWASETRGEAPDIMADDFAWGKVGQRRIEYIKARTEARRRKAEAQAEAAGARVQQSKIDVPTMAADLVDTFGLAGARAVVGVVAEARGINLKPTERAALNVPAGNGQPTLTIEGPDGTREVPPNVIDLASRRTGTDGAKGPGTPTGESGTGTDAWQPDKPLATAEQAERIRPSQPNIAGPN